MNIVIVGSGNVGRALGTGWRKAGHSVTFAARDPTGAKAAELKRDGFAVAPQGDAGKAEAIVLAVPWTGIEATVRALGDLAGKIVIDATNPLTANLELVLGFRRGDGGAARQGRARREGVQHHRCEQHGGEPLSGRQGDDAGRRRRCGGEAERDGARG